MSRILFVAISVAVLLRCSGHWRRVVSFALIAAITGGIVFPPPAYAQADLAGGFQGILNNINGGMRSVLNTIGAVSQSLEELYQDIVWPVELIDRARNTISSLIMEFRGLMESITYEPVGSATLSTPARLEAIIRNGQTSDFSDLSQSYYQTFGALPDPDRADPLARNMIDMDDGLALNTLKTSKAADQMSDLILESGNQIEDEAQDAAPGSAPFLTAGAMAANIQSQAMMQKLLAAMLRQEAARMAHENGIRKRHGILVVKVRQSISDLLKRQ